MRRASSSATSRSWGASFGAWSYSPACRAAAARWASISHRSPRYPSVRCASPPTYRKRSARRSRCCARIAPLSTRCWSSGASGTSRGSSSVPTTSNSATCRCRYARSPPRAAELSESSARPPPDRGLGGGLRLLELVVEVDARGARLADCDAVPIRYVSRILSDVIEERTLVGDIVDEHHCRPTTPIYARTDIGELIGGQRIDVERGVRAAARVGRLGARRHGELISELVPVRQCERPRDFRHLLNRRACTGAGINEARAHQGRV